MEFFLFFALLYLVDAYFYDQGHDGLFFVHKTDAEKEIQRIKIDALRRKKEGERNDD
jgi:hypothetical protein